MFYSADPNKYNASYKQILGTGLVTLVRKHLVVLDSLPKSESNESYS